VETILTNLATNRINKRAKQSQDRINNRNRNRNKKRQDDSNYCRTMHNGKQAGVAKQKNKATLGLSVQCETCSKYRKIPNIHCKKMVHLADHWHCSQRFWCIDKSCDPLDVASDGEEMDEDDYVEVQLAADKDHAADVSYTKQVEKVMKKNRFFLSR
jgi:hypothetical protein